MGILMHKDNIYKHLVRGWHCIIIFLAYCCCSFDPDFYQVHFQNERKIQHIPRNVLDKFNFFLEKINDKNCDPSAIIYCKAKLIVFHAVSFCYSEYDLHFLAATIEDEHLSFFEGLKVFKPVDPDFVCKERFTKILKDNEMGVKLYVITGIEKTRERYQREIRQFFLSIVQEISKKLDIKYFSRLGFYSQIIKEGLGNIQCSNVFNPAQRIIFGYDLLGKIFSYKMRGEVESLECGWLTFAIMGLNRSECKNSDFKLSLAFNTKSIPFETQEYKILNCVNFTSILIAANENIVNVSFKNASITVRNYGFYERFIAIESIEFKNCEISFSFLLSWLDLQSKCKKLKSIIIDGCYFLGEQYKFVITNPIKEFSNLSFDGLNPLRILDLMDLELSFGTLKKLIFYIDRDTKYFEHTICIFKNLVFLGLKFSLQDPKIQIMWITEINNCLATLKLTEIVIEVVEGIIFLSYFSFNECKNLKSINLTGILIDICFKIPLCVKKFTVNNVYFFLSNELKVIPERNLEIDIGIFNLHRQEESEFTVSKHFINSIVELKIYFASELTIFFNDPMILSSCMKLHVICKEELSENFLLNCTFPKGIALTLENVYDIKFFISIFTEISQLNLIDCPNFDVDDLIAFNSTKKYLQKLRIFNNTNLKSVNFIKFKEFKELKELHFEGYTSDVNVFDSLLDLPELRDRLEVFVVNVKKAD